MRGFPRLPASSNARFPLVSACFWQVLQWARGHIKYGVLHIHGLYTDPCGMVLDPSGYKDVTQDPEVMVRPAFVRPCLCPLGRGGH